MNEARFMALLGAYGADLARWPEDDRAHAEVFLDGAPHRIKDVWESERSFDHLLALERDVPSSIALETAVIDAAPGRRAIRRSLGQIRWPAMPKWATGGAIAASLALVGLIAPPPANARGRATLEQSYERYSPRIRAGGTFYATDLKKLVASGDFEGVKLALAEPPSRQKSDLVKPDAGVAARARQAGQFSDARVLVAADLWASSFSESSISAKTKKMQESIIKVRDVIEEMQEVARLGLGEEKTGGLFGLGAKKADKNECAKKLRELYVQGGNAWNEYVLASNDNLPLQFDKFEFVK